MEILSKTKLGVSFDTPFFFKDCSLNYIDKKFGNLVSTKIDNLKGFLPDRKFLTVDIGFQVFKRGDKSCVDTGWHVDGIGNDYLILCEGDFRTEFLGKPLDLPIPNERSELRNFNKTIACKFSDVISGSEIPDSTLVRYSSLDIHKGRVATSDGQRLFLRLCSSDYLKPKNYRLM